MRLMIALQSGDSVQAESDAFTRQKQSLSLPFETLIFN
jgi:hypothetical protein